MERPSILPSFEERKILTERCLAHIRGQFRGDFFRATVNGSDFLFKIPNACQSMDFVDMEQTGICSPEGGALYQVTCTLHSYNEEAQLELAAVFEYRDVLFPHI